MFKKAGPYFTQVRFLLIVLFLKVFQKLSLEFVNIFNISKNGGELCDRKHRRVLATLSNVALQNRKAMLGFKY